jgi:urea transport system substrate-binding protein
MKKTIDVGILHSLSGTMSFSEAPLVDAALMAFDEINQNGGILGVKVRPVVEDCQSEPETYAFKAQRLNQKEGIVHFFGCWTSASRKAVKSVVEATDGLLWYPVQYEGLEESANIVYTGNCLNQQIEPAVHWAAERLGKSCYLVGSDYIFPRTANRFIRTLCTRHQVKVLAERYLPLGAENFERIVDEIKKLKPAVVFNTINGDSNLAFYYYLNRIGIHPERVPVMAFSIGEVELKDIGPSAIGHYACSGYFQCLKAYENIEFIKRYEMRYGQGRPVSDAVVSAYIQPYLWKDLVERSRAFDVSCLKNNIAGTTHAGPSGTITIHENHHALRPALIGRVNGQLQFDLIWQSPCWIPPLPWLGLEGVDLAAKEMIQDALASYPEMLDAPRILELEMARRKKSEQDLRKEKEALKESMASYKTLLDQIRAGIVLVDLESGLIRQCNEAFEQLTGRSGAMLKKMSIWELGQLEERQAMRQAFYQKKILGDETSGRMELIRPDGRAICLMAASSVISLKGRPMLQAIIRNCAHRK